MTPDELLAEVDPEQQEVVRAVRGPVCVFAGAGTGKTRAITHRIAYGVVSGMFAANQVLAVTFTARAAGELRGRLRALGASGVAARTFHSAALRQLGHFWPKTVGGRMPRVITQRVPVVAEAAARFGLTLDRTALRDIAAEIAWSKVSLVMPSVYPDVAEPMNRAPLAVDRVVMSRLITEYENIKTERWVLDFEDVLLVTAGVLQEYPAIADTVRRQYRYLVVDEYQDVNPLQQHLLDLWVGGRQDICVVGDPAQTIYSFAGATPSHLLDFPRRYPDATVVRLVRDYRSTPQVVTLANRLMAAGKKPSEGVPTEREGADLLPNKHVLPSTERPTVASFSVLELVAVRPAGPLPTMSVADDDSAEAADIAQRVTALIASGTPAPEIAVLVRTNGQTEPVEQAFTEAGIGYVMQGGERFFARRIVQEAVMLLRGAARAGSTEPTTQAVRDVLTTVGWAASEIAPTGAADRERREALTALVALIDEMVAANPQITLTDIVADLDERAASQQDPPAWGVTIASLHAAKGLEWDGVFIAGLSEGLLPTRHAVGVEAIEEERRLLYVGITRARRHLHLSWAKSRAPGSRPSRQPSRFLSALDALNQPAAQHRDGPPDTHGSAAFLTAVTRPQHNEPEKPSRQRLARCLGCGVALSTGAERKMSRCSQCPSIYDEQVLTRLREWRAIVARTDSVPEFVILTDATLLALAQAPPTDLNDLADVPGVGKAKQARYGAQLMAALRPSANSAS
ncbi:MAG: ATP-dependent DNA helicase UvrD2 [Actinomycetota bacterium]